MKFTCRLYFWKNHAHFGMILLKNPAQIGIIFLSKKKNPAKMGRILPSITSTL
ncbi:hypothetical protein HMPREF1015_02978 [Bacillus smithii 7_3_47FAA]|uniref:Uncharacterized protein n=1 Tax=Bacillus smithii 7_3_47FAA TaxID=665952 RepID=G9QIQ1_9BACI|nr:hypothetical protein HMPREF1015_02978 [Bacillus smithii 7_3_47FAA]